MAGKNEPTFEKAIMELEETVKTLEKGDIPLDDAIKAYTRGMELIGLCNKKLDEAQGRISMYVKDADGNVSESEFISAQEQE